AIFASFIFLSCCLKFQSRLSTCYEKRINAIGKNSKEMKQRRSLLSPRYRQTALEVYPSNATREEDHKRAVFASYIHKGAKPLLTTAPEGPLSVECCILDRLLPLQH
uniref:NET domain-containing protein n=1 Tax=Parascaris univalens TaxID=6257 RepID=A0A914ZWJ7_PARUN